MDLSHDPISFEDFKSIWQALEGSTSSHDAYDAYLAGVSEALQQAACTCDADQLPGYMQRIVAVSHMRRGHKLGTQDSTMKLGQAMERKH